MYSPPCAQQSHRSKCITHERSWHHPGPHTHTILIGRCMILFPCTVHPSSVSQRQDLAMSAPLIRLGKSVRMQLSHVKEFRPLPGNLHLLMRKGKYQGLDSREVARDPLLHHPLSTPRLRLARVIAITLSSLMRLHHLLTGIYPCILSMGIRLHRWRSIPPQHGLFRNRNHSSSSSIRASSRSTIASLARRSFANLSNPVASEPV